MSESCTGTSADCPADAFLGSAVTCRESAGICDVAETCTGAAGSCPANAFASTITSCSDEAFCNGADTCDGAGACGIHAGDPCLAGGNVDCLGSCNEALDSCAGADTDGIPCNDGNVCTNGETCSLGICGGGSATQCDDGDLCTENTCDPGNGCTYPPAFIESGCLEADKGLLMIRDSPIAEQRLLRWSWKKGEPVTMESLGTPTVDTEYALCLYDTDDGVVRLAGSYSIPAATVGWEMKPSGLKFVNKTTPPDGIYSFRAAAAARPGKSGVALKGLGSSLPAPDQFSSGKFFQHDPIGAAQLVNTEGACWTTEFVDIDFSTNSLGSVKATYTR